MVRRDDLPKISKAVEPFGLIYRHVAGVDMLVQAGQSPGRRVVRLMCTSELSAAHVVKGFPTMPLESALCIMLQRFGALDRMYVRDIDIVGLISAEMEAGLSDSLHARLLEIRSRG